MTREELLEVAINPQFKHSEVGTFLFNLCAGATKFFVQHKEIYYILAWTWGIILTIAGLLVTALLYLVNSINALNMLEITFNKYLWIYYVSIKPDYWGGFSLGQMFVRDKKSKDFSMNAHEFGHTIQNCIFGPFMIFLVCIPSVARYWNQTIADKQLKETTAYDAAWFEDAATQCGQYVAIYSATLTLSE